MISKVLSASIVGVDAKIVNVEVDVSGGFPSYTTVGLADTALKESKERVKSAIKNCGFNIPLGKIIVNLSPASMKKSGAEFDLPIAIGMLIASGQISSEIISDYLIMGELALDGGVNKIKGGIIFALCARYKKFKGVIVPPHNVTEASVVSGIEVIGVSSLLHCVEFLTRQETFKPCQINSQKTNSTTQKDIDFSEIAGQEHLKRALTIAVSGNHNILMMGPPGAGKSLAAKSLSSIMPEMTFEESLETTKIYSSAGLLQSNVPLVTTRPFRSPHHSISDVALIGGGKEPKPGEVTLAHNGILFLDELPEFKRNALEALRQPLEDKKITISRAMSSLTFPSNFMLVASMNPCPCGFGFSVTSRGCTCSQGMIQRYRSKISGPLLDRIDIHIEVPQLKFETINSYTPSTNTEHLCSEIVRVKNIQIQRFKECGFYSNSDMRPSHIKKYCPTNSKSEILLKTAMDKLSLSARAYHKILKLARTIADLDGKQDILENHIAEAIQYRALDRRNL